MQRVAAWRGRLLSPPPLHFAAIVNCGAPDAHQADAAVATCALAAREAWLSWCGGLSFGEGDVIAGRDPATLGSDQMTAALEIAALVLLQGGAIPIEAQRLAARPTGRSGAAVVSRRLVVDRARWYVPRP